MADLVIDNPTLANELRKQAEREGKSIDILLAEMVAERFNRRIREQEPMLTVEVVRKRLFERARRYWREHDDPRAQMSDVELEAEFWLFDHEGVPRLKSEQGQVEVLDHSLVRVGLAAEKNNLRSGRSDSSSNRERITEAIVEHFRSRRDYPYTD